MLEPGPHVDAALARMTEVGYRLAAAMPLLVLSVLLLWLADALRSLAGVLDQPPARATISALGDSNVQIRFHAWVDQRSHDFLMVKSEAIRTVKLALERAGMDMPEPIYRVQITERGMSPTGVARGAPASARPGAGTGARPAHDKAVAVDTRAHSDLRDQIRSDPRADASADLLDPAAPKE